MLTNAHVPHRHQHGTLFAAHQPAAFDYVVRARIGPAPRGHAGRHSAPARRGAAHRVRRLRLDLHLSRAPAAADAHRRHRVAERSAAPPRAPPQRHRPLRHRYPAAALRRRRAAVARRRAHAAARAARAQRHPRAGAPAPARWAGRDGPRRGNVLCHRAGAAGAKRGAAAGAGLLWRAGCQ